MTLCLTNTMKRTKEPFAPANPDHVTMYVCGPTVYNFAHIGNARPAVVFDVLYRRLERRFGRVVYARKFTDVDDKINAASMGPEPGSAASAVQCSAGPEKGGTSLRDRKSRQEADGVRLPARPPGACRPPACTRPSCGTSSG